MFFNAALLIIGGFIGLIGTILCLVFMVIGFSNRRRSRYAWLVAMLLSFLLMIGCIFVFMHKVVNTIQSTAEQLGEGFTQSMDSLNTDLQDNRNYLLDTTHPNAQVERIRSYIPDSLKAKVPTQFFTYFGFQEYYRLPIRYPYALHAIDHSEEAFLYDERRVRRFDRNNNGEESLSISRITAIAYDDRYFLASINEAEVVGAQNPDEEHYLLFVFDTQNQTQFRTKRQLFLQAKKLGYNGPDTLATLNDYKTGFNY